MAGILISVPGGESVTIGTQDASSLTDALWAVSTTAGAVVLVGKLRYALGSESGVVTVSGDDESTAMRAALEQAPLLTPALAELRTLL